MWFGSPKFKRSSQSGVILLFGLSVGLAGCQGNRPQPESGASEGSATGALAGCAFVVPAPAPPPVLAQAAAVANPLIYSNESSSYVMNSLLSTYNGTSTAPLLVVVNGTGFTCADQVKLTKGSTVVNIQPTTITPTQVQFYLPVVDSTSGNELLETPGTVHVTVSRSEDAAVNIVTPSSYSFSGHSFTANFVGLKGVTYQVQKKTDLSAASWTNLTPLKIANATTGNFTYVDTNATSSSGFYQAVAQTSASVDLTVVQAAVAQARGSLAASGNVTCAQVTTNGQTGVQCWGGNQTGELGNNPNCGECYANDPSCSGNQNALDPTCVYSTVPVQVFGLTSGVTAIAVGPSDGNGGHACAVQNGQVLCWGENGAGEVGIYADDTQLTSGGSYTRTPGVVFDLDGNPLTGVSQVAVGASHSCALLNAGEHGSVVCWGDNSDGQLGVASTDYPFLANPVVGLSSGVAAISAGDYHTCALMTNNNVYCWGANFKSQLSDGTPFGSDLVLVKYQTGALLATAIAAGGLHTCALGTDKTPYCWGNNSNGELGTAPAGTTDDKSATPLQVPYVAVLSDAIGSGQLDSCSLVRGGLYCWGADSSGQLGVVPNGATTLLPQPSLALNGPINDFVLGSGHSCALVNGAVKCWADNSRGQLGNNSTGNSCSGTSCLPQQVWGLQGLLTENMSIAQSSYTVQPGQGSVVVTVNRTGVGSPATVQYATQDGSAVAGTDYTAVSTDPAQSTLSFAQGEMSKTFTVQVATTGPGAKSFKVLLQNPSSDAFIVVPSADILLNPPPVLQFTTPGVSAPVSSTTDSNLLTTATLTVGRTMLVCASGSCAYQASTTGTSTVTWTLVGTSTTGTVTIPAGQSTANFQVPITHQQVTTISYVTLSAATGGAVVSGTTQAYVTVDPLVSVEFYSNDELKLGPSATSASFTVARSMTTVPTTVTFSTLDGSAVGGVDYAITNGTLTWAAGDTTNKTITVNLLQNHYAYFNVVLTATSSNAALGPLQYNTAVLDESDPEFCAYRNCGTYSGAAFNSYTDSNGFTRTANCGTCGTGLTCGTASKGILNVCGNGNWYTHTDSFCGTTYSNPSFYDTLSTVSPTSAAQAQEAASACYSRADAISFPTTALPPSAITVKITTAGALGAMKFTWKLGSGAVSAAVTSVGPGAYSFAVPGTSVTLQFPVGTYVLNDSYTIDTHGAVTLPTGSPPHITITGVACTVSGYGMPGAVINPGPPGWFDIIFVTSSSNTSACNFAGQVWDYYPGSPASYLGDWYH